MAETVVVFQEDCILAARGKEGLYPHLSHVKRIPLLGTGDSFARWAKALSSLDPEWKARPVRLVLPAGMSSTRVLSIPPGKGRQLAGMALRQVENSFRNEISDYSIAYFHKKEGVDLCAGGGDAKILEHFMEICEEADIAVAGMTVPMEGELRLLKQTKSYGKEAAIYLFFEEGSMTSILFRKDRYLYSSRSRLFGEPGTLDFGTEIVRNISGILQFYAGRQQEMPITRVYYGGCPEEDFEAGLEGIRGLGLEAEAFPTDSRILFPAGEKPSLWLPCIGAFIRKGKGEKQIDLYAAALKTLDRAPASQIIGRHFLMPGVILAAGLFLGGILGILNWNLGRQLQNTRDWMERSDIQKEYQEALAQESRLQEIQGGIAAVKEMEKNLSSYPVLSSRILDSIEQAGGGGVELKISGYDAQSGLLTFRASSREIIDIPDYILRMQETGIFQTVDYTGYAYEGEWYTLSLSCILAGNTEKGGAS